jgi:hypothetical protein
MIERELIRVDPDSRPILVVVIHTEEEFDWDRPQDRSAAGVAHMRHIARAQTSTAFRFDGISSICPQDAALSSRPKGGRSIVRDFVRKIFTNFATTERGHRS